MTDLAKLVVKLEAQTGQYQAQLERANGQLARFEKTGSAAIGRIAGIIAGVSFVSLIKGSIDAADRMNDLSKQTGFSVEALSGLKFAAEQSGADLETLVGGLRKFSKAAIEATSGGKDQAEAFRDIGVSVKDAAGNLKPTEQLLLETAEAFSGFRDGAAKSATAQKLFGKTGAELIPFLNEGAAGIKELTKRAGELGLVISSETAQAADDFNDKIAQGKAQVTGFITQAIGPLLPQLTDMADAFFSSADGATDLSGATSALQTGLKLIADLGLSVVHTFRSVGKDFGALAAAAVQAAQGNFTEAAQIIRERRADDLLEQEQFQNALTALWSDGTEDVLSEIRIRARKIGRELRVGGKDASDALSEVVLEVGKVQVGAMDALFRSYENDTKSSLERTLSEVATFESKLQELFDAGKITDEQFIARRSDNLDAILPEIEVGAKKISGTIQKGLTESQEYVLQFQRNTQDILGDSIYDAYTGKLDDIPKRFADMILQLIAQAQAAKIAKYLFGDTQENGLGNGGGGFLGTIGKVLGGLIGGGRAAGGPVQAGKIYRVNENTANSEWFAPSTSGTVIPNGGGGMSVVNNFTISTPDGRLSQATQMQISSAASRGLAQANRRGN